MIIFAIVAIGLVVIVAGGFVGRSRMNRAREQNARNATHKTTHHGKGGHKSRTWAGPLTSHCGPVQVGRRVSSS